MKVAGRRPDGLGAKPGGNDLTPFVTMNSDSLMEEGVGLGVSVGSGA